MRRSKTTPILVALLLAGPLSGCSKSQQAAATPPQEASKKAPPPIDPATVATINGTIHFQGTPPSRIRIRMDAVPYCVKANSGPVYTQDEEVNPNKTLQDVFVYVKQGLEDRTFPAPAKPAEIDQKGCWYYPHVLGIMVGQKLDVKNSDDTTHNIHVLPADNREWNMSMPPGAPDLMQTFARPEVMVPVKCNVHPWMKAYIGVVRNPFYAVTGKEGTFTLSGMPPGQYTIEAWQEKYGTQDKTITLGPKETKTLDFTFPG
jgi:plastocyanin